MQEKPAFSSYFNFFFPNVWEGDTNSHTHPLRTLILPSGTPLPAFRQDDAGYKFLVNDKRAPHLM